MAYLKFNKNELVNLSYSLRREIILANRTGAYCNSSIVCCNTRRYHGLLAAPVDAFGDKKFILLSSLDETLSVDGRQFNLGIHCYGDIYEPRGHKYIVDFTADGTPEITYRIGQIVLRKRIQLADDADQVLIQWEIEKAPEGSRLELILKPFLGFRGIHELTQENPEARTGYLDIEGGVAYNLYRGFPDLNIQLSRPAEYRHFPDWYKGVTYSDEYRRGFDCREDLFVPGSFLVKMKVGDTLTLSASTTVENPKALTRKFTSLRKAHDLDGDFTSILKANAETLKYVRGGKHKITAGFSWLYSGLLRETIAALPGLTLYANGSCKEFEQILDDLISAETERLYHRTTQIEAPLQLADTLQQYIDFCGPEKAEKKVWKKYGKVMKDIVRSYLPGERKEVHCAVNGLLWAQLPGRALTWMNTYINGNPVTERPGFQVEVNAFWYNAVCFCLEMNAKYDHDEEFERIFTPIKKGIEANFTPTFYLPEGGYLADFVYRDYKEYGVTPNQVYALSLAYSPISEDIMASIMNTIKNELVTRRGLRTLSPRNPAYKGVYEGTQIERDLSYQRGSAWPYLLAPYINAMLKIGGESYCKRAEWLIEGFEEDIAKHGVGCISELYDGDPPHEPHGAISSAMSTAALLRIKYLITKYSNKYNF